MGCSVMLIPILQSVKALPHSIRQVVSEHDKVQSTYSISHLISHFAAISSSLKMYYGNVANTAFTTGAYTHGQVLGSTNPRKSAQAEAKSKISILFRMIGITNLTHVLIYNKFQHM